MLFYGTKTIQRRWRELEREKSWENQISKFLEKRSCKDIWSLYNQMTVDPKEDLLLKTESGDTTNDPKLCADQFAKAFYTKVERQWSQSGPKSKPSINIGTIPRQILIVPMKFTTQEIRNEIYSAKNSWSSGTDGIDANFLNRLSVMRFSLGLDLALKNVLNLGKLLLSGKCGK